jgi:hypothetical protein
MAQHPFSPIINTERLELAIAYIADQSLALARTVLRRELDVDTICFFAQSPAEYRFLEQAVRSRGPVSALSHGPTLYVDSDFEAGSHHIRIFGVRRPDPTRPQAGYGDYPVPDYARLLAAEQSNPHVKEITSGRGQPLIELRHPDFDVLGFVVDAKRTLKGRDND